MKPTKKKDSEMKTKEERNAMTNEMIRAVCHGGFGRLQVMIGATADNLTDNSFQFAFKMFRKANLFKIELDEAQDLYNCYFIKRRNYTTADLMKGLKITDKKFEPVIVAKAEGLFCDQVQEFFETTTGLRTCL